MVDQIRPEVTILSAVNMQVGGAAFGVDRSGNRLSIGIVISPVGQAHCEVTGKIRRNDGPRKRNFLAGEAHEKIDCSRRPLENLLPSANVVFLICDLFLDRKRCVERNTMVGAIIGVGKCPIFRYKDGVLMKRDTFQISHSIQFIQAGSFERCKSLLTQVQSKKASLSIFNMVRQMSVEDILAQIMSSSLPKQQSRHNGCYHLLLFAYYDANAEVPRPSTMERDSRADIRRFFNMTIRSFCLASILEHMDRMGPRNLCMGLTTFFLYSDHILPQK